MATSAQTIIDQIRFRTNMESNQFVTDAELLTYINASLSELDDILIDTYEDYKVQFVDVSITNSVDGYNYFDLPSDFCDARKVERQFGEYYQDLTQIQFNQKNSYNFPTIVTLNNFNLSYRILGMKCFVYPHTNAIANYRFWYVPKFITLSSVNSTLEPYMDLQSWHEYCVADCAIKIMMKQDLDPQLWMAVKDKLAIRIVNAAKPRDQGGIKKVADTRSGRFGNGLVPIGFPWWR